MSADVAIVHDYLTQRGGAERVALSMLRAFPGAALHTSLYDPAETFPEFADFDVRVSALDRARWLREDHRRGLPFYAATFGRWHIDADLTVCSSSGWAHGVRASGRKVVYCHAPARWLDQPDRYLADATRPRRAAVIALRPFLDRWDRRAASSADLYLANSRATAARVRDRYRRDATVVAPPFGVEPDGPEVEVPGIQPGFLLAVSRLLPYKNVDAIVDAVVARPDLRLVVVGDGPERDRLRHRAPAHVTFLTGVDDPALRWLYRRCRALVTASYEDYGLTPLEAASQGRPTAALRFGGFLDTIQEGQTGLFFDEPTPGAIRETLDRLSTVDWDPARIAEHAATFSEPRFIAELRGAVASVSARRPVESGDARHDGVIHPDPDRDRESRAP